MNRSVSFLLIGLFGFTFAKADTSDDTLRLFLTKSDLIVDGVIASAPIGESGEAGVINYVCDFNVGDVIKGDQDLRGKTIRVSIVRFENVPADHHPLIRDQGRCRLFLRRERAGALPRWSTADFWFGVQHPFPWMARSLRRLTGSGAPEETATLQKASTPQASTPQKAGTPQKASTPQKAGTD